MIISLVVGVSISLVTSLNPVNEVNFNYSNSANSLRVVKNFIRRLSSPQSLCPMVKDCRLLAEAIVYEARGEPREGRIAVGKVILNRVESKAYPDTLEGVLQQPYQFSYVKDKHKQTTPRKKDWKKAYNEAMVVLGGVDQQELDLEGVLWYHASHVSPSWSKKLTKVATIGNHHFYRK